jgi:hypothetical protein
LNVTVADCGDASLSVTVTVIVKGSRLSMVPVITPSLKVSPVGRPLSDQLYGPCPPEGVSVKLNGRPIAGDCLPGLAKVSVGYEHATLACALALSADGDVTTSVSVMDHWFDPAVTESGTLTVPPAEIATCFAAVLPPLERAQ